MLAITPSPFPETVYNNHASGSENLFRSDENYHYFLKKLHRIHLSNCRYPCLLPHVQPFHDGQNKKQKSRIGVFEAKTTNFITPDRF
jgi:hypothetical protein